MLSTLTLSAAGILLREGLEAILVLTALAAYLTKINAQGRLKALWTGAGIGVVASIATAWVFSKFYGGEHNDMLEGFTMLLAAGLMLYVSGWLYLRQNPRLWQAYLKGQVDKAMGKGSILAIGSLAFLAIYREGAETALFINALAQSAGEWNLAIFNGLLIGSGGLAALFILLRMTAVRLPLRPMFLATSALLFLMALSFIADAIQEFQELGWILFHDLPAPLRIGILAHTSAETCVILILVALTTLACTVAVREKQARAMKSV